MPSASITARRTKGGGRRYVVRFRLGGRAYPIQHGGAFPTMKEARARRDLIAGELANGRNPTDLLRSMVESPSKSQTVYQWRDRFLKSRHDADDNTIANYRSSLNGFCDHFEGRAADDLTVAEVAEWVAELAAKHKPGTVRQKVIAVRLLLDFAGCDPNPARDPRVKLPKHVRDEPDPPSSEHVLAILAALGKKWRLMFVTIEQGALRVGEAVSLKWGDVDAAGLRLRLPRSATKRDQARWIYLPEWLMQLLDESCPMDDRTPERPVFQGITEASFYQAMKRACSTAKIPHYSPHGLRHRRITVWHQSGVVARELAERAGHARPSMSLDVYSHVMPLDEVPMERFEALIERA
jgi:integrase